MADILNIAVSGLKAHQTALAVTGNNISNATTEGYSRQTVSFETSNSQYLSGNWQGTGVTLETVSRIYDEYLTEQVWTDTSDFNYYETLANYAGQIDHFGVVKAVNHQHQNRQVHKGQPQGQRGDAKPAQMSVHVISPRCGC